MMNIKVIKRKHKPNPKSADIKNKYGLDQTGKLTEVLQHSLLSSKSLD